jgi:hypothetical protein
MPLLSRRRQTTWFASVGSLACILIAGARVAGQSQNVWKAKDSSNVNWSNPNNWTAQVIANGQLAVFSSNSATLFAGMNDVAGLTVAGIVVNGTNTPSNPITVGGNAFGIAANGIDMSAAATDLIANTAGISVTAGQTWTVSSGRTITINPLVTGVAGPALTITGGGTVRLNAGASGLGPIQLTGGTLLLGSSSGVVGNGTLLLSGTSTLAGLGAIVPNTGTVSGNLVKLATGTTLSPGIGGVGTITVGSAAVHGTAELDGGAAYAIDLGSATPRPAGGISDVNTNDRLVTNGVLKFDTTTANVTLTVNGAGLGFTPFKSYDYFVASGSDGLSGFNPAQLTIVGSNFSLPGSFSAQSVGNGVVVTYAPVPEAEWLLLAVTTATGAVSVVRRRFR